MTGDAFKHIVVTSAEEDDEIVHAGLGALAPEAGSQAPSAHAEVDVIGEVPAARVEVVSGETSPEPQPTRKPAQGSRPLDDLRAEPMSATQKAVIIAAVICIIGALIYYFVALR